MKKQPNRGFSARSFLSTCRSQAKQIAIGKNGERGHRQSYAVGHALFAIGQSLDPGLCLENWRQAYTPDRDKKDGYASAKQRRQKGVVVEHIPTEPKGGHGKQLCIAAPNPVEGEHGD